MDITPPIFAGMPTDDLVAPDRLDEGASLDRRLPRTRWKYQGRARIDGRRDCHVWTRELPTPDPTTGYRKLGFAIDVDEFWPSHAA